MAVARLNRESEKEKRAVALAQEVYPIILFVIVLLGAFLTYYYAHANYPYPIDVDEWSHIYSAEIISHTWTTPTIDIYTRAFQSADVEQGYSWLLAVALVVFHINIFQWQYVPMVIDAFAILSVFLFVSRLYGKNAAIVAALLIALLPTNVVIGGPAFLMPVDLGLIFIPLGLLLAFERAGINNRIYNYSALFLVIAFLLYSHPPTAMIFLSLLGFYFLVNIISKEQNDRKKAEWLFVTVVLACLIAIPNYLPYLKPGGMSVGDSTSDITFALFYGLPAYGILQSIFFFFGAYLLLRTRRKEDLTLLFGAGALFIVTFLWLNLNIDLKLDYQRAFIPMFLLMSIIASVGYTQIIELKNIVKKNSRAVAYLTLIVFLLITVSFTIQSNLSAASLYYHVINSSDYQNFLWIKANLNNNATVMIDPIMAKAFGPITGMKVYSVEALGTGSPELQRLNNTYQFFIDNCMDTQLLLQNNISIVYSKNEYNNYSDAPCENANLTLVHNSTYILK